MKARATNIGSEFPSNVLMAEYYASIGKHSDPLYSNLGTMFIVFAAAIDAYGSALLYPEVLYSRPVFVHYLTGKYAAVYTVLQDDTTRESKNANDVLNSLHAAPACTTGL